jgi:hypothetical protein
MKMEITENNARSIIEWFFGCYSEFLKLEDIDAEQVKFLQSICDTFGTDGQKKTLARILNEEI